MGLKNPKPWLFPLTLWGAPLAAKGAGAHIPLGLGLFLSLARCFFAALVFYVNFLHHFYWGGCGSINCDKIARTVLRWDRAHSASMTVK